MISKRLLRVAISLVALYSFTFSSLFAQSLTISALNLTSANLSTVNISDAGGTSTISLNNSSKISNTNANGKTINYVGNSAGLLNISVSDGSRLESANNTNSRVIYFDNANADLVLNATGNVSAYGSSTPGSYNGAVTNTAIEIASAKSAEINLLSRSGTNFISGDIVNRGSGALKIVGDVNTVFYSDIFLGANAASNISLLGGEISGSVNFGNDAQTLNIASSYFEGTINNKGSVILSPDPSVSFNPRVILYSSTLDAAINSSVSTPTGNLIVASGQTLVVNADIGATNAIKKFDLQSLATVDLSASNKTITAFDGINLANNSTLKLGDGSNNSQIKLGSGATGLGALLQVKGNNTLSKDVNIGLGRVSIDAEKSLTIGANKVVASSIILNSNSSLNIGSGVITGIVEGAQDGVGKVGFNAPNYNLNLNLGSSTKKLQTIAIENNATLNLGSYTLDATNVTLGQNAVLNVDQGAISDNIIGASNGVGRVNFAETVFMNGVVGSNNSALETISIASGIMLNLGVNSVNAKNLELSTGSLLLASTQNLVNLTNSSGNSKISLSGNSTIFNTNQVANSAAINYAGSEAGSLTIDLAVGSGQSKARIVSSANAVKFDNSNADLIINNSGSEITGDIIIDNAKTVKINIEDELASSFQSSNINGDVVNNSAAKLEMNLKLGFVDNVKLGSNADSKISLQNFSSIRGDVTFGNSNQEIIIDGQSEIIGLNGEGFVTFKDKSSTIWLKGSVLEAKINSFSDIKNGRIIIGHSQHIIANADIGSIKAIDQVTLSENAVLNLAQNNKSVAAQNIFLNRGSKIEVGSASISGNISNVSGNVSTSVVQFNSDNKLAGNIDIGAGSIIVKDNVDLDLNNNSIKGAILLSANSSLNIGSGLVLGSLRASENGVGSVSFEAANYNLGLDVGSSEKKLQVVAIKNNATLNLGAYSLNANLVTLGQNAVLNVEQGEVSNNIAGAANGFGKVNFVNSASINGSLGGDNSALAEVDIASGKAVNLDINSTNVKDLELALGASLISSGQNVVNLTNASGANKIALGGNAIIFNQGRLENSSAINYSGSEAGSLTLDLGVGQQQSLARVVGDVNAIKFDNANADLVINNSGSEIYGNVVIDNAKSIKINNEDELDYKYSAIYGDVVNNSAAKLEMNLRFGLVDNVKLGSNADSKISLQKFSSIGGDVTFGNSNQEIILDGQSEIKGLNGEGFATFKDKLSTIWLKSSVLEAKINSFSEDKNGRIIIGHSQSVLANADIGSLHAIGEIELSENAVLNLAQNNKSVAAENILLNNGSKIEVGSASVNGNISNSSLSDGSDALVKFNADNNLKGDIAIGLGRVEVAQNVVLNLGDNQISANGQVLVNEGSVINLEDGAINSDIASSGYGYGTVNFSAGGEFNYKIGSKLNPLSSVNLALGKALNLADLATINALNISIANNAQLNSRSDQLIGNILFEGSGQLRLNSGSVARKIDGSPDGLSGNLYINSHQNVTTEQDLGRDHKLSSVELGAQAVLNLDVNNNYLGTKALILNDGSVLNIGYGLVESDISASSNGVGEINFKENYSLSGNVGSALNAVSQLNIFANKTLNNDDYNIDANQIFLNSGARLRIGSGVVSGLITGAGQVSLDGQNISNLTVGANNQNISAVTVHTGKSVNLSNSTIYTDQLLVHYNSKLALDGGVNIYGELALNKDATLTLSDGNFIKGAVKSYLDEDSYGTFTVNASNHVVDYEIGDNNNFLHEVNFAQSSNTSIYSQINSRTTNIFGSASFANTQGNIINGDLNVANGATLNLFAQNHNVAGNLNIENGATIKLEINRDNQAGSITAAGLATVNPNTNIRLTIEPTLLQERAKSGLNYTIISGAAGSDIGAIASSNIALLNNAAVSNLSFSTTILDNSLILNIVQQQDQPIVGGTDGQRNLYRELLNLNNVNGGLLTLKQLLLNSQDPSFVLSALDAANPQIDNSINRLPFENTSDALNIASKRINALRGASSGSGMSKKSVWAQTFGAKIHQGNSAISNGYNATTQGFLFGFDKEVEDDLVVGTSISFVDSRIDSIGMSKSTNLNSYQLNVYAGKDFSDYFVNTMLGFSYNKYTSQRKISLFNLVASGNYNGQTYISRIEAGSNFRTDNDYILTPLFTITAAKNIIDDYQETSAQDYNLAIKNNSTSFFETRLGVNVSKYLSINRQEKIMPSFGISYGYDFAGSKQKTRSTFVGQDASFSAKSANIPQGSLRFEVGAKIFYMNAFSFDAVYAFDLRNNYHAHSGSIRAKYEF